MPTHVALLRGINVGGRTRVAMADLREVVSGLGHDDVATYVQSGNVVFSAQEQDTTALAAELERAIAERLDVEPAVVVLSRDELAAVVAANPFPDETDFKRLHAVFSAGDPGREDKGAVAAAEERARAKGSRDEARFAGGTLFLHTPDGMGRSVLAAELTHTGGAMAAGARSTARNWATVTKLLALLDG